MENTCDSMIQILILSKLEARATWQAHVSSRKTNLAVKISGILDGAILRSRDARSGGRMVNGVQILTAHAVRVYGHSLNAVPHVADTAQPIYQPAIILIKTFLLIVVTPFGTMCLEHLKILIAALDV